MKDPGFIKNFVANGLKLGMAYENELARRAKTMVDQYAREIFMVSITPRSVPSNLRKWLLKINVRGRILLAAIPPLRKLPAVYSKILLYYLSRLQ